MNGSRTHTEVAQTTLEESARVGDPFHDEKTTPYNEAPKYLAERQGRKPVASDPSSRLQPAEQNQSKTVLRLAPRASSAATAGSSRPENAGTGNGSGVPLWILKDLLRVYGEHMGVAARPVLVLEMRSLGVTPASIHTSQMPVLVGRLARRLDTIQAQDAFLRTTRLIHPSLATY